MSTLWSTELCEPFQVISCNEFHPYSLVCFVSPWLNAVILLHHYKISEQFCTVQYKLHICTFNSCVLRTSTYRYPRT